MHDLKLRGYLRERWRVLVVLGGWSVLEAGETFLVGFALARAMDQGFLRGRQGVGLGWLALAAVAVPVGAYGTGRVYRGVAALVEPLRDLLVRRVVGRGLREAVGGGAQGDSGVVSRLTHQVEIARDALGGLVMVLRSFVFTAIGALAGLLALSPDLLLVVGPPLLVGVAGFALVLRPMAARQHRFLAADEAVAEELGALTAGLRDITACGAQQRMADRASARVDAELRAARSLARWGVLRATSIAVGGQLPVVLLLLTTPWLLSRHVTPGALLGALTYLTQSLQPALQNLVHALSTAGTRLGVVLGRLSAPPAPGRPRPPAPGPARTPGAALELRGVTFAYGPAAEPVLRDLHLTVAEGEHLAVVGPSGIGKSTLAALAAGLLAPSHGDIRRTPDLALVPQEAYVFTGTVAENLNYLRTKASSPGDEDLAADAAAEQVGSAGLIAGLGGAEGRVDPGTLSAGERQLLALTRTYLSPAPLVLLDEATCHLDPAAEERAERAFARRPGGTLVVIAHRISSALRADRILVMDGAHATCGTHEELLDRSPLYRDLVGGWSSHPAGAAGDPDGVHPVAGPGLTGDRGQVVAHRAVAQMQAAGDLRDGGTLGAQ
ncbi:ABC transporter ATP-binding protein [Streptomyces sp. NPDC051976]|uniref:ABC transporter ATP-binding protein n=1 Tax=Streptomyces sp. NPDC051976 TaxID=3154947 RepID=UPI0034492B97